MNAYGFEPGQVRSDLVLSEWENQYGQEWLLCAIVECLHQGRYKLASVGQMLRGWERRGQPRLGFDREFQRFVLGEAWQPIIPPVVVENNSPPQVALPGGVHVESKLRALAGISQAS
ncbi:MAG: hypothetical protein H7Y22_12425 [Gemmatimonadaceae bacterium]|nr:hypothetical protein [Gloeobacterales cyanobacterium ES-bin-141]